MELSAGDMAETKCWTPAGLIEGRERGPHFLFHLDAGVVLLVTTVKSVRNQSFRMCICYDAETGKRYNISEGFLRRIDTRTVEG